jgi:hypothetical protein
MSQALREALKNTAIYVSLALKALKFWHRQSPVTTVADLAYFTDTRSKYVAQTTLFGYVKTRAGTKYVSLFEDEAFAESLRIANWQIYLACLSDMAVYAAARVGAQAEAPTTASEMEALARHLADTALDHEDARSKHPDDIADFKEQFTVRLGGTNWDDSAIREASFKGSPMALVEWAPIADELKKRDVTIVRNSMRFKWKRVRDDLDDVLDADAVMADWRARPIPSGDTEPQVMSATGPG